MTEQKQALSEHDLEQASGGESLIKIKNKMRVYDNKNRWIGMRSCDDIDYYPCEKCGRPTHCGTFHRWYCDPCNTSYYDPDTKRWNGTEEELKALSL